MSDQYGIIGYPLSHSFSPSFFLKKFTKEGIDAVYNPYEIPDSGDFIALRERIPNLKGLNVTIPFKQSIIPYLDEIDEAAKLIGAVNCISVRNNKTKGYNTDHIGFSESLKPLLQPFHTSALVLGTGGSSKAIAYALDCLGIDYQKVSRKKGHNLCYHELKTSTIRQHKLIINTTPVGMHPNNDDKPLITYDGISEHHLLYDLIYNPAMTAFLSAGLANGATIKNGLEMLEIQAEASWRIWNDESI
jgi:shikimate dehydrogenase